MASSTAASEALKVPPHDLEAERSVLGAILIDAGAINLVAEFLKPEHFYEPAHQLIFSAMLTLFEKQQPIDIVTVVDQLKLTGNLKKIGGKAYLSDLINTVPTSANIEKYGQIVKDHYTKRKLIEVSSRTVERAFEEQTEVKKLLDEVETEIFALSREHLHRDFIHLREILAESFERLDELMKSGLPFRGLATGFDELDKKLAGLQPSNLIILAARPALGKTSLALNISANIALKTKQPVGIFSLEMSKEELVDRLLIATADIDAWRLKTGRLSDDDYKKITEAMGELSEAPLFIDDTPGISILEMRAKARKLKVEHDLKLLVVDYLQLADAGRRFDSRVQEVSFVSQGLKNLARELRIPVLALSQLSRAVEQRGGKKPQLSDLRESGSIEQDSDVVLFLYQEEESEELLDQNKRLVKLLIAKHRNGPVGEIDLMFRGDRVRFYSVEK
jgi:replicative DNA helicase